MRTQEQVISILETSFSPLTCHIAKTGKNLAFRIFERKSKALLTYLPQPLLYLFQGPALETSITAARARLEQRGHGLLPWSLSTASTKDGGSRG